jgi:hypothetical protein
MDFDDDEVFKAFMELEQNLAEEKEEKKYLTGSHRAL